MPDGTSRLDPGHDFANSADHVQRIGRGERPDAHEHRSFAIKADIGLVVFCAEHDISDVAKPHHNAVFFFDDELPEFLWRAQVRIGDKVHRHHRAFRPTERRQVIVSR